MQAIRPASAHVTTQMLDTVVKGGSSNDTLRKLLGIGSTPATVRHLTNQEVENMGYMGRTRASPYSSLKHVSSAASALTSLGQTRSKFTMVDAAKFEQLKNQQKLEFIGLHGTARYAADAIAKDGIDHELMGRHTGGVSKGGRGIYTVNSKNATSPEDAEGALKVATNYGRRAGLTGADPTEDKTPTIMAVFRTPSKNLISKDMPLEIQGNPEKVEAYRQQTPAHEYTMGSTPRSHRLKDVEATTTLITDNALRDDEMEYFAVEFKPAGK